MEPKMNDEEQLRIVVREAVGSAVKETLLSLGIDPTDAIKTQQHMAALREVSHMLEDDEFKADLVHLRKWRKSMDQVSNVGIKTAVGIIVTSFFGMIVFAVKEWFAK